MKQSVKKFDTNFLFEAGRKKWTAAFNRIKGGVRWAETLEGLFSAVASAPKNLSNRPTSLITWL